MTARQPDWTQDIPTADGRYWVRYSGKHGVTKCLATVMHVAGATVVKSDRHDIFVCGPRHGGPRLRHGSSTGKRIEIWFWPSPIATPGRHASVMDTVRASLPPDHPINQG